MSRPDPEGVSAPPGGLAASVPADRPAEAKPVPTVVLCGLGTVSARVAELLAPDHAVLILSRGHDEQYAYVGTLPHVRLLPTDFLRREALEGLALQDAAALLALAADDFTNLTAALLARELYPQLPLLVRIIDPAQAAALGRHLSGAVGVSVPGLAAPVFGIAAYRAGHHEAALHLGGSDVFLVGDHPWLAVRTAASAASRRDPATPLPSADRSAPATVGDLERLRHVVVLACRCATGAVELLPEANRPLQAADDVVIVGPWQTMAGRGLPAPSLGRAFGRAWSACSERTWSLVGGIRPIFWAVLGVLLAAIALNAVVFALAYQLSPLDAAYFVVATITTVGYGDINLHAAPAPLKAYGVFMMLSGALVMAAVYAVVTDALVGSRLNELLGARLAPRRGHVIVCGLGTVGSRTAQMLRAIGEPVVAVDGDITPAAAQRVQRQEIPVIPGDATSSETLERAGVTGARCVVAATSDDHTNLAIALAAREAAPGVAVVLRLFERSLVGAARVALGIDETISAIEPAARALALAARLGVAYRAVLDVPGGQVIHVVELAVPRGLTPGRSLHAWLLDRAAGEPFRVLAEGAAPPTGRSRSVVVAATAGGARRLVAATRGAEEQRSA